MRDWSKRVVGEGLHQKGCRRRDGLCVCLVQRYVFEGYGFFMTDGMDVDMITTYWFILLRIYWYLLVVWEGLRGSGSLEYTNTELSMFKSVYMLFLLLHLPHGCSSLAQEILGFVNSGVGLCFFSTRPLSEDQPPSRCLERGREVRLTNHRKKLQATDFKFLRLPPPMPSESDSPPSH